MEKYSRLALNEGEILLRTASIYPTLLLVVLEQVQNALDANAKHIGIVLNRKTRHIAIRDDGDGVSRSKFEGALLSVGSSRKTSDKLGRFGIGLISPLGKCQRSTFTSLSKADQTAGYLEWTFITDDIRSQSKEVRIPCRPRPDLQFRSSKGQGAEKRGGVTMLSWRTEVDIYKYSTDKVISRIESVDVLIESIFERYAAAMRRNEVELSVKFVEEDGTEHIREKIKASTYSGKLLGEISFIEEDVGRVRFNLYLARKTQKGYAGKVVVGEIGNDYRFGFSTFVRTTEGLLPDEVADALVSGIFEGEILGEKIRLNSSRKSFEANSALVGFCTAIESWYREHGKRHLEKIEGESEDERYQELGARSLATIEEMLRDNPAFAKLREAINGFMVGNIGKGHTPPDEQIVVGRQEKPSIKASASDGKSSVGAGGKKGRDTPRILNRRASSLYGHRTQGKASYAGEARQYWSPILSRGNGDE